MLQGRAMQRCVTRQKEGGAERAQIRPSPPTERSERPAVVAVRSIQTCCDKHPPPPPHPPLPYLTQAAGCTPRLFYCFILFYFNFPLAIYPHPQQAPAGVIGLLLLSVRSIMLSLQHPPPPPAIKLPGAANRCPRGGGVLGTPTQHSAPNPSQYRNTPVAVIGLLLLLSARSWSSSQGEEAARQNSSSSSSSSSNSAEMPRVDRFRALHHCTCCVCWLKARHAKPCCSTCC
jgi:hypothetical protein